MKMAVLNDEAAADHGMADRVAASFMREVALLKVWEKAISVRQVFVCCDN